MAKIKDVSSMPVERTFRENIGSLKRFLRHFFAPPADVDHPAYTALRL